MAVDADLLEHVLHLPSGDRALLARELLLSLDAPDEDLDAAWSEELDDRIAAYERGDETATEWREAIERVRQSLQKDAP